MDSRVTAFEAWFGRKPHWTGLRRLTTENIESNTTTSTAGALAVHASDASSADDTDETPSLRTALEERIFQNNKKLAAKMIAKAGRKATEFKEGALVSLAIPRQLKLSTELKRLPCRVVKVIKGSYTLLCQFGHLRGRYRANNLNALQYESVNLPRSTTELISLTKAVQLMNSRGTISARQKTARFNTAKTARQKSARLNTTKAARQAARQKAAQQKIVQQQTIPEKATLQVTRQETIQQQGENDYGSSFHGFSTSEAEQEIPEQETVEQEIPVTSSTTPASRGSRGGQESRQTTRGQKAENAAAGKGVTKRGGLRANERWVMEWTKTVGDPDTTPEVLSTRTRSGRLR